MKPTPGVGFKTFNKEFADKPTHVTTCRLNDLLTTLLAEIFDGKIK